jgi:hypothetical protein
LGISDTVVVLILASQYICQRVSSPIKKNFSLLVLLGRVTSEVLITTVDNLIADFLNGNEFDSL